VAVGHRRDTVALELKLLPCTCTGRTRLVRLFLLASKKANVADTREVCVGNLDTTISAVLPESPQQNPNGTGDAGN